MADDLRDQIALLLKPWETKPHGDVRLNADRIAAKVMAEVVTPELERLTEERDAARLVSKGRTMGQYDQEAELERLRADRIVSCVFAVRSGECPLPFALYRRTDETGVSGEGTVAYGVQFADGMVVIRWLGDHASTVVWDDLDKAMQVHGHRGSTRVVWLAEQFEDLAEIEAKAERAEQAEAERDALKATTERIRRAVVDVYGEDYGGEDIAAEVERLFGHLSEHDVNVGRLIGAKNEALERAEGERAALKAEMEVQRAIVAEFDQVATEKGGERDALKAANERAKDLTARMRSHPATRSWADAIETVLDTPPKETPKGWHCRRCGSPKWVAASLTGPVSTGGRAIKQCVPCGYYSNDPVTEETDRG